MLKLTRTGIGLLTRQYRSVLRKCFLMNAGLFAAINIAATAAPTPAQADASGEATTAIHNALHSPTLDAIAKQSANYIAAHSAGIQKSLTALTNQPTAGSTSAFRTEYTNLIKSGAVVIRLNGKYYSYTPTDTDKQDSALMNLLHTGSAALTETNASSSKYDFMYTDEESNAKYYIYDSSKLPTSAWSASQSTVGNFTMELDGTTYTIKLKDYGNGAYGADATATQTLHNQSLPLYFKWSSNNGKRTLMPTQDPREADITYYKKQTKENANTEYYLAVGTRNIKLNVTDDKNPYRTEYYMRILDPTVPEDEAIIAAGEYYAKIKTYETAGTQGTLASSVVYKNLVKNGDGGALAWSGGSHGDILADFINNKAGRASSNGGGGALYNRDSSTIGDITGDFIGNYIESGTEGRGGALWNHNYSTIGDITGDFIGNYIESGTEGYGGALFNQSSSTIGDITGDFIGNYIESGTFGEGGALYQYNSSTIGDITGDFIGNYIESGTSGGGGALYNVTNSTIGDITGDFIGNYIESGTSGYGGALWNHYYSTVALRHFLFPCHAEERSDEGIPAL